MKTSQGQRLGLVATAPLLGADPYGQQLQTFHSWAHSPMTLAIMAVAWAALAVAVFTPLGQRITGRAPSATLRAAVVVLGILGVVAWVTHNWWFTILMLVLLWGVVVWYLVTLIGSAVSRVGGLAAELDPEERARQHEEHAAAAQRGAALERVLDEIDGERPQA
jgi:hypothetical protein